jgi:hypothetical protein
MPRRTFQGKENKPENEVTIEVAEGYEPYQKTDPLPEDKEYELQGGGKLRIKWFNAFGVRVAAPNGADANVPYTVTLKKRGNQTRLFYLTKNGEKDLAVEISNVRDVDNGNVQFDLSIGDPPIGQFP